MDNYEYKYYKYKMKYKHYLAGTKETLSIQKNIDYLNKQKNQISNSNNYHFQKTILVSINTLLLLYNNLLKLENSWLGYKRKLKKEELKMKIEREMVLYQELKEKRVEGKKRDNKLRAIKKELDGYLSIDYHKTKLLKKINEIEQLEAENHSTSSYETQKTDILRMESQIDTLWKERMTRKEEIENTKILKNYRRIQKGLLIKYGNIVYDSDVVQDWTGETMSLDDEDKLKSYLERDDYSKEDFETPWEYIKEYLGTIELDVTEYENNLKIKIDLEKQNKEVPSKIVKRLSELDKEISNYYEIVNKSLIDCLRAKIKWLQTQKGIRSRFVNLIPDIEKRIKWLEGDHTIAIPSEQRIQDPTTLFR